MYKYYVLPLGEDKGLICLPSSKVLFLLKNSVGAENALRGKHFQNLWLARTRSKDLSYFKTNSDTEVVVEET